MSDLVKDLDYNSIQLLYGVVLLMLAGVLATYLFGNVYALTAVVCMLLIKDGLPNFIVGAKKVSAANEKKVQ